MLCNYYDDEFNDEWTNLVIHISDRAGVCNFREKKMENSASTVSNNLHYADFTIMCNYDYGD